MKHIVFVKLTQQAHTCYFSNLSKTTTIFLVLKLTHTHDDMFFLFFSEDLHVFVLNKNDTPQKRQHGPFQVVALFLGYTSMMHHSTQPGQLRCFLFNSQLDFFIGVSLKPNISTQLCTNITHQANQANKVDSIEVISGVNFVSYWFSTWIWVAGLQRIHGFLQRKKRHQDPTSFSNREQYQPSAKMGM